MRKTTPERLENGRVRDGPYGSGSWLGLYGAFKILGPHGQMLAIMASAADDDDEAAQGWEHVSVSLKHRTPNWQEMCFVKDLFWEEDECVVQYHPPKKEHVDFHPNCLHMWRKKGFEFPMPPAGFVGPKESRESDSQSETAVQTAGLNRAEAESLIKTGT
jgi:hypothetical protein